MFTQIKNLVKINLLLKLNKLNNNCKNKVKLLKKYNK